MNIPFVCQIKFLPAFSFVLWWWILGRWAESAFNIKLIFTIPIPQIFIGAYYMLGSNLPRLSGLFTELLCWWERKSESESCSVVSTSLRPRGLYSPWNSPGQNTGVGSISLLQGIFPTQGLNSGLLRCRRILYHPELWGKPGERGDVNS